MPMIRGLYPQNWEEISTRVKWAAGWKCKNCGISCRKPGETFDTHKRTLTVAHLNHKPWDNRIQNLKALCPGCHLKHDAKANARKRWKWERWLRRNNWWDQINLNHGRCQAHMFAQLLPWIYPLPPREAPFIKPKALSHYPQLHMVKLYPYKRSKDQSGKIQPVRKVVEEQREEGPWSA